MSLSYNGVCYIIGFYDLDKNNVNMSFKCIKCNSVFDKIVKKYEPTIVICNRCKSRFVVIPKEISEVSGKLIDLYVITYSNYYKYIRNWLKVNKDLLVDKSKSEVGHMKLICILSILSKNKGEKKYEIL